ncbi:MarR family transcriptional regulator [uncultured Shimia sp.]|uniref:MarR family winged helix-turn-helix transcriptional regulator n=1 Tax=uncultured Shimia sp. TaxID=573152 RepID=UPI00262CFFBC|nr:MarR family transcriptional regulator [uncultured Shimia sp.]
MTETASDLRLEDIELDSFAPYLMNRIMGRYNASMRNDMAQLGLTTPKVRTLAVLASRDGILIGQLAVYAVVEHSTLSRALDGLAADKLIRRVPDQEDARATRVFLTKTGRETFDRLWPGMEGSVAQMFDGISSEERSAFVATLQRVLKNVRHHDF